MTPNILPQRWSGAYLRSLGLVEAMYDDPQYPQDYVIRATDGRWYLVNCLAGDAWAHRREYHKPTGALRLSMGAHTPNLAGLFGRCCGDDVTEDGPHIAWTRYVKPSDPLRDNAAAHEYFDPPTPSCTSTTETSGTSAIS